MADQQQLIDELIHYIDKAVLKNSVSNRHVAEVLDWLNEGLKKIKLEELAKIFLRKDQDESTNYLLTMFAGALFGNFSEGPLGSGACVKIDPITGKSYIEVDELFVRMKAYFTELIIATLRHVGGNYILTPASMKCIKVEELADVYRCYFKKTDGDRTIHNEFVPGDQATIREFNIESGMHENIGNRYYWRLVTAIGDDYIDLSKTDCDANSDVPTTDDDICQLGNRNDRSRQNAIILSSYGDDAPSFKQYKGIDGYTLHNKEVTVLSPTLNKLIGQFISSTTGENFDDMFKALQVDMALIKEQTDKEYTIWFFEHVPALNNIPASDWTTPELKELHDQDLFYNRTSGLAYRFEDGAWIEITDQYTVKALENAAKAQDTADGKRRVFVAQPTNAQAYDIGDLWVNATYSGGGVTYKNDSLVCIAAKTEGAAFSISHWKPSSAATTAYLENLGDRILAAVTDSAEGIEAAKKLANQGINDAYDAYWKAVASGDAASKAQKDADALGDTVSKHATAIQQTKESISALAGKITFDANGKVTNINTSGLVTTSDFNTLLSKKVTFDANGKVTNISTSGLVTTSDFAGLFASQATEDGLVKRADISTFITSDQAGNLISNATIQADQINFTGKTIINDNFVVSTDGAMTVRNMTVTDGCLIAGFRISGSSLSSGKMTISDRNILFSGDDITAGLGINTAPAALGLNVPLWINNNSSADKCIAARFSATGAAEKENNIALALIGCISGFAVKLRSMTSGGYLTLEDCFVSCSFTGSDQNVYLPKDPPVGKVYLIKRWPNTGKGPIVHANGSTLNGGATSDLLKENNHLAICIWGGKSWSYNKISL